MILVENAINETRARQHPRRLRRQMSLATYDSQSPHVTEAHSIPLTAINRHDGTQLLPLSYECCHGGSSSTTNLIVTPHKR